MIKWYIYFLIICFWSCNEGKKKIPTESNQIQLGKYVFWFPAGFKKTNAQGVDSSVGTIESDSIKIHFDYGFYSSSLDETPEEFLEKKYWLDVVKSRFTVPGVTYYTETMPKVEVLSIRKSTFADSTLSRGCDYVALCEHKRKRFEYGIHIPEELKRNNYMIDTLDGVRRKVVYATRLPGFAALNMCELEQPKDRMEVSLTLYADSLSTDQQDIVLKAYRTGKRVLTDKLGN